MRKLHLIGVSDENDALMFTARRGSKTGSYVVEITDELVAAITTGTAPGTARAGATPVPRGDGSESRGARLPSTLSPREIQARLRAGRSVADIAREAQCNPAWVERFAAPILAEQAQIVDLARALTYTKPRLGESAANLGESVSWNLADKGVVLLSEDLRAAWISHQLPTGTWVVKLRYRSRGRAQEAGWELDLGTGRLAARNRLASELGYVEPGRRRRPVPEGDAGRSSAEAPVPRKAPAPKKAAATKKTAAKRPAPKKAPAAKKAPATKKTAAKKAPAKKAASATKKAAPAKKQASGSRAVEATASARRRPPADASVSPVRIGTRATRPTTASSGPRLEPAPPRPARADLARQLRQGTGAGVTGRGAEPLERRARQPSSASPGGQPSPGRSTSRTTPSQSPSPARARESRPAPPVAAASNRGGASRPQDDDGEPTQAIPVVIDDGGPGERGEASGRSASDDAFLAFLTRTTAKHEADRQAREVRSAPRPEPEGQADPDRQRRYLGELDPLLVGEDEDDEAEDDVADASEAPPRPAPPRAKPRPAPPRAPAPPRPDPGGSSESEPPPPRPQATAPSEAGSGAGYWTGAPRVAEPDSRAFDDTDPPRNKRRPDARTRLRLRRREQAEAAEAAAGQAGAAEPVDPTGPGGAWTGAGGDGSPAGPGVEDGAAEASPTRVGGWRSRRGAARD